MGEREHSDDWQTNSDNDIDALVTGFLAYCKEKKQRRERTSLPCD